MSNFRYNAGRFLDATAERARAFGGTALRSSGFRHFVENHHLYSDAYEDMRSKADTEGDKTLVDFGYFIASVFTILPFEAVNIPVSLTQAIVDLGRAAVTGKAIG